MTRVHTAPGFRGFALVLLCCLLLTGCGKVPAEPAATTAATQAGPQFREDLTTILLMGLDKYERPEGKKGYTNQLQSDFLMLLVIDETAGTCQLLHLNRDTMAEIRILGIGGDAAGKFTGQLALAHTYGSGGSDSCLNAVKSVSKLLGGIPVDHYMSLTMDAVGTINDLVGGVTVTVLHDFGGDHPQLKKGEQVTLKGDLALTYVRSRMTTGDGSNQQRMERQQQYLEGLITKLMERNKQVPDFLKDCLLQTNDSFVSDMTVNQLEKLSAVMENCEVLPIQTIPGETKEGEEFVEFYPDPEALEAIVTTLFYEK